MARPFVPGVSHTVAVGWWLGLEESFLAYVWLLVLPAGRDTSTQPLCSLGFLTAW